MSKEVLELFDRVTIPESFGLILENCELKSCHLNISQNMVDLTLACAVPLARSAIFEYCAAVENAYHLNKLNISLFMPDYTPDSEYLDGIITAFVHEHGACRPLLSATLPAERIYWNATTRWTFCAICCAMSYSAILRYGWIFPN